MTSDLAYLIFYSMALALGTISALIIIAWAVFESYLSEQMVIFMTRTAMKLMLAGLFFMMVAIGTLVYSSILSF